MFSKGDFIIYGSNGVCVIEEVGVLDSDLVENDKLYYTLRPLYSKQSTIFTPVDNDSIIMRPILTEEEAFKLIDDIKDIDSLWIADEKTREHEYKEAIKKCDCKELVKIIKTIYMRKESRIAEGKKITYVDEKYFNEAEDQLYGELAVSLKMTKDETKNYIIDRVEQLIENNK